MKRKTDRERKERRKKKETGLCSEYKLKCTLHEAVYVYNLNDRVKIMHINRLF